MVEVSKDNVGDKFTVKMKNGVMYTGTLIEVTPNCIRLDLLFFNRKDIDDLVAVEKEQRV